MRVLLGALVAVGLGAACAPPAPPKSPQKIACEAMRKRAREALKCEQARIGYDALAKGFTASGCGRSGVCETKGDCTSEATCAAHCAAGVAYPP